MKASQAAARLDDIRCIRETELYRRNTYKSPPVPAAYSHFMYDFAGRTPRTGRKALLRLRQTTKKFSKSRPRPVPAIFANRLRSRGKGLPEEKGNLHEQLSSRFGSAYTLLLRRVIRLVTKG